MFPCLDDIVGNWGLWSGWSYCSVSCGGGVQIRKRLCNNPEPENGGAECRGPGTSAKNCNRFECRLIIDLSFHLSFNVKLRVFSQLMVNSCEQY